MVGRKNDLDDGYSWTLLQHGDRSSNETLEDLHKKEECNSKISVTWGMMDQCFETIIDRPSGINVLESIVYSWGYVGTELHSHY